MARPRARSRSTVLSRLRFALLYDGRTLDVWHLRCLEELSLCADLAGGIVAETLPATGSTVMRSYAGRLRRRTSVDVTGRFPDLRPGERLDFVLRLGPVAVDAAGSLEPTHGVWCFEHEDEGPALPFARDVHDGAGAARAALVGHPTRDVLEEGYFPTRVTSYRTAERCIVDAIASWPARVCRRITEGKTIVRRPAKNATAPSVGLVRLRAALAARRAALAWQRLFRHPQWNVGVVRGSPLHGFDDAAVEWFPLRGRRGFLADPFAVVRDDDLTLLCEYFSYGESRGRLCALTYAKGTFSSRAEIAFAPPFHVSYPCAVDDAKLYCVPETAAKNEVALYEVEGWTKVAVLLHDFPAVDPTVFRHGDRWWLTCTRSGPLEDTELCVWHAPELFGPWEPHAENPVKTDVRAARPAGLPFNVGGELYRPAQDCSRLYGWRVAIQRITHLTPTEFAEEPVAVIEATAGSPYPDGRHTLAVAGDRVFVDGLRTVFVGAAFRAFLGIWARDVRARVARR